MATLSSIITPSNITTATNTQTLTNKTLTGAAMNGTVGATTPSTVAATTLSANTTNDVYGLKVNAADSRLRILGHLSGFGGALIDAVNTAESAHVPLLITSNNLTIRDEATDVASFSSTGLAVTGTLSSTASMKSGTTGTNGHLQLARSSDGATITNFVTDGSNGIINSVIDTIFQANTTERMRITSAGNVGIGLTAPVNRLEVVGTNAAAATSGSAANGAMRLYGSGSGAVLDSGIHGTAAWLQARQYNDYAGNYGLLLNPNGGNVGIGTTSPSGKLEISLTTGGAGQIITGIDNTTGVYSQWRVNGTATKGFIGTANQIVSGTSINDFAIDAAAVSGNLIFSASQSEKMRILNSGNVGIGTASPASKLHLSSTGQTVLTITGDSDSSGADVGYTGITMNWSGAERWNIGPAGTGTNNLVFRGAGSNLMTLTTGGNVLIGTASGVTNGGFSFDPNYNGTGISAAFFGHSSAGATSHQYCVFAYNGTSIGSITQNGTTGVLYNVTSDYRRKSNVKDLTGSGAFIDALKPRTFDWDTGDKGVGFIAHEFAEVSPLSVSGEKDSVDADGKPVYQSMQAGTAEVIANLVAELQSLRKRLAALESK